MLADHRDSSECEDSHALPPGAAAGECAPEVDDSPPNPSRLVESEREQSPPSNAEVEDLLVTYTSSVLPSSPNHDKIEPEWPAFPSKPNFQRGVQETKPSIFDKHDLTCQTPNRFSKVNSRTGGILFTPYCWPNTDTPRPCNSFSCEQCAIRRGRRIAGAIALARPDQAVGLSLLGPTRNKISQQMAVFLKWVRKPYPDLQLAWAAESNPNETGMHVHGYSHTGKNESIIPDWVFEEASVKAGIGPRVGTDEVWPDSPARYTAYGMKSLTDPAMRLRFLDFNGSPKRRSLIQATGSFLARRQARGSHHPQGGREDISSQLLRVEESATRSIEDHDQRGRLINRDPQDRIAPCDNPKSVARVVDESISFCALLTGRLLRGASNRAGPR